MFKDRVEAGKLLAEKLTRYKNNDTVVVLGLARGGVPVAAEVAKKLSVPLDVCIVRKLGAPGNAELAIGAVAEDGTEVLNDNVAYLGVSKNYLAGEKAEQVKKIQEYRAQFTQKTAPDLIGRTAVLVDDGLATGASMTAAVRWAKKRGALKVIVAVPVAPPDAVKNMEKEADEVVVVERPEFFMGVAQFYEEFPQITTEEVVRLLRQG